MSELTHTLTVGASDVGIRLDRFLAAALGASRSSVQRLVKEQRVLIDGKPAVAHALTQEGQRLSVNFPGIVERHRQLAPTVLKETDDFLVIEKPAGLLVHATPRADETTLVDWLKERYPTIGQVGDPDRPGIVHRIDRDVSGLLVIAKTPAFYVHIQNEFRERRVHKEYTALVLGTVATDDGDIRLRIARSRRRHGRMAARPEGEPGKEALTRYAVIRRYQNATLLSVDIATGRTHQIRAHLFGIGHPVVGDRLYHPKHAPHLPPLDRLFLHARELGFRGLDGSLKNFRSPLPHALEQYLTELKETGQSAKS